MIVHCPFFWECLDPSMLTLHIVWCTFGIIAIAKIISASESLFWSACFVATFPLLTKRNERLKFLVYVQVWNVQHCPDKLSRFFTYSRGKSVLSSSHFNLNAGEGFTNDIRQDLADNKSWFKVVCTSGNVNTVMRRCAHKLACFTLEQILRKLNTVNKNTPCGTLQISKLYTRLRF